MSISFVIHFDTTIGIGLSSFSHKEIRSKIVEVFAEFGAASNQIGKTYPMLASLNPDSRSVLRALKKELDPEGLINPGALGNFSA